jgi:hypothetical protein
MHVFVHHIWWFYKETNGRLNDYAMEGSEKLNDFLKLNYNRNSNKRDIEKSIVQIFNKQSRREIFSLIKPNQSLPEGEQPSSKRSKYSLE